MKTYWDSSALIEALHDPQMRQRIKPDDNGTRAHTLTELFSTLTKGVQYRYGPDDAAKMLLGLAPRLTFVDLTAAEVMDAIEKALKRTRSARQRARTINRRRKSIDQVRRRRRQGRRLNQFFRSARIALTLRIPGLVGLLGLGGAWDKSVLSRLSSPVSSIRRN